MIAFFAWLFGRGHAFDTGLDFEAQLLARQAERKAALLRRAARYADEGLPHVAQELRQRAEALSFERSLGGVLAPAATEKPPVPTEKPAEVRKEKLEPVNGKGRKALPY
jgi:hypothetical protein